MTDLSLADSRSRLGWLRALIARIAPVVEAIDRQGKRGDIVFMTAELGSFGYARYMLASPIPVPDEIGFIIADIAVNARSCLDMAIQRIVTAYGLPIDMNRPGFRGGFSLTRPGVPGREVDGIQFRTRSAVGA